MKCFAFQTIRPVVSRKKARFSAHFGPGGAVPPPSRFTFFKVENSKSYFLMRDSVPSPPQIMRGFWGRRGSLRGNYGNAFPRFATERLWPFCRKQRPDGRPQAVPVRRLGALRASTAEQRGFFPLKKCNGSCSWSVLPHFSRTLHPLDA